MLQGEDTFSEIITAWLNVLGGKNRSIAVVRLKICHGCIFYVKLTSVCKRCTCPMVAKSTLLKKTCPLGKW